MKKLVLASSSKYRKELLSRLSIRFETFSPDVDEDAVKARISDPVQLASELSLLKAQACLQVYPDAVIIGSDQVAHLNGKILGKAGNLDRAREQLEQLSGQTHQLITAVTILDKNRFETFCDTTNLCMKKLTNAQINFYLSQDHPIDCAGSYKLELKGIGLFDSIDSMDHTAIVGLPLIKTGQVLTSFGFQVPGTEQA